METTKGILTPRDIDGEGRYYFVRKAMDAGDVVRLKNGVYATQEGLANTMVDVERTQKQIESWQPLQNSHYKEE